VTERWSGPKRKDHIEKHRFGSASNATRGLEKLILIQRNRGFHEIDSAGRVMDEEPLIPVYGAVAVQMAKRAIVAHVVPVLRSAGFKGTFPLFRRIESNRHALIWVSWGRSGGFVSAELAVVPSRKENTIAQDYRHALGFLGNGVRTPVSALIPRSRGLLLFFDEAAEKWGASWPIPMADILLKALQGPGERWLRSSNRARALKSQRSPRAATRRART
jgi:hypothetical protein